MEGLKESKKKLFSIEKKTLIALVFLVLGSLFFESKKILLGIIIGGGLSLANIIILGKIGEGIFLKTRSSKTSILASYVAKMIVLFGLLFLLITKDIVNIIAFAIGFSSVFLAMGLEIIFPAQNKTDY